MPRTADPELAETRRAEILDAATACFVKRGIHQTTMREIIGQAGLSAGAVYSYFESKDTIIEALAARDRAGIYELATHLEASGNASQAIIEAVYAIIEECTYEVARLGIEFLAEAGRNGTVKAALERNDRALRDAFAGAIKRGMASGTIKCDLPESALLETVVALYEGFMGRIAVDRQADARHFAEIARSALQKLLG